MFHTSYWLQIVNAEGEVVQLPGGGKLELDLINSIAVAVQARGVGLFRTEAHVMQDVRDAVDDVFKGLKYQTAGPVNGRRR